MLPPKSPRTMRIRASKPIVTPRNAAGHGVAWAGLKNPTVGRHSMGTYLINSLRQVLGTLLFWYD